jgi:TolB-like protein
MRLSINYSTKAVGIFLTVLICLSGCAVKSDPVTEVIADTPFGDKDHKIAVFPVLNLSGAPAPLKKIRQALINSFKSRGLNIIDENVLEKVFARHRIRYIGGINEVTARALREEIQAEAVVIVSLELYSEIAPPKVALTTRLVSTAKRPQILWIDGIGLAGDDSPGLLELSLVENPRILLETAVQSLASSLSGYLSGQGDRRISQKTFGKFRPKAFYRSPVFAPHMQYTVAVVPFYNISERKNAGDIIALHFIRQLSALENFDVVEPGAVRQALLRMRIIMGDGLSLGDADILFRRLDANLILTGKILD